MHPEPFHIGPLTVALYGLSIGAGLILGIWLARRENDRTYFLSGRDFERVVFWMVIWGFLTARLFYLFTERDRFVELCLEPERWLGPGAEPDCFAALRVWEGGLVFYGGPIGAIAYLFWRMVLSPPRSVRPPGEPRSERWSAGLLRFFRFGDLGAAPLALAHAFGRLGCLFAGCCYGSVWHSDLAIVYPEGSDAYAGGFGRYPVPLMEAAFEMLLFLVLVWKRPRKRHHGELMLTYLIAYPMGRVIFEIFRGDAIRGYAVKVVWPAFNDLVGLPAGAPSFLTTSQLISLCVVVVALFIRHRLRKRWRMNDL